MNRIWQTLKNHKKKSITVVAFFGLYLLFQYAKKTGKLDFLLKKLSERVAKQIEKSYQQTEKIRRINDSFEGMYVHYLSLMGVIKKNLIQDINGIFSINKLKEQLKPTSISAEERKLFADQYKSEIFIHAAFSMIYLPLAKTTVFLRECIINKSEDALENLSEKDIFVFESFCSDLAEYIIRIAGKYLFNFLQTSMQQLLSQYDNTTKYSQTELLDFIQKINDLVTQIMFDSEQPCKYDSKFDSISLGGMQDFSSFFVIGGKSGHQKKQKTKIKNKAELVLPSFKLKCLDFAFIPLNHHRITTDIDKFAKYYDSAPQPILHKELKENEKPKGPIEINLEEDQKQQFSNKQNLQSQNSPQTITMIPREKNESLTIESISLACDELFDFVESRNFHLFLFYSIRFEFAKLLNRIQVYFQKTKQTGKQEKMLLFAFLPILHKIVNEEFFSEESDEANEKFYTQRLKTAFTLSSKVVSIDELEITSKVLKEIEMKRYLEFSLKEYGKRIFLGDEFIKMFDNQRSVKMAPSEEDDLSQYLNMLSETNMARPESQQAPA